MVQTVVDASQTAPATFTSSADLGIPGDRRRPGRAKDMSAALIPLLRGSAGVKVPQCEARPDDPLRTARGLLISTAAGLLIWAGAFYLIWSLLN